MSTRVQIIENIVLGSNSHYYKILLPQDNVFYNHYSRTYLLPRSICTFVLDYMVVQAGLSFCDLCGSETSCDSVLISYERHFIIKL